MDLRKCFERFPYSHASIIYNSLSNQNISKIIQVGIRDYCEFEYDQMVESNGKVQTFFDLQLKERQFKGESWHQICQSIIDVLPPQIYITFDIDGLNPAECPDTGTPVPGGFTFAEAAYLLRQIKESGRKVVGFDLVEVAPSQNEINVINGARVLYELIKSSMQV
jgi:agmatinase